MRRGLVRQFPAVVLSCLLLAVGLAPAVAASPAAAATAASPAASGPRVTFGIEPSAPTGPDGRSNFMLGATPGAVVHDYVAVVNYSSQVLPLKVYASDALDSASGQFSLPAASSKPSGVGSWITLPAPVTAVNVGAEGSHGPGVAILPIVIRVPLHVTAGDHAGAIVASLQTLGRNSSGQDVVLNQRLGTRVFVRVTGVLMARLTVTQLRLHYDGNLNPVGRGTAVATYQVTNAGNVQLGFSQHLRVTGLVGASASATPPPVAILLPGASVIETVRVPNVWPQLLANADLTVQPVAVPGDLDPHLGRVTGHDQIWTIPWPLIVLLLIVVGALVLRRRGRRDSFASSVERAAERIHA